MDAYRIVTVNKSKNAAVNLTNNVFDLGNQTLDDLTPLDDLTQTNQKIIYFFQGF